MWPCKPPPHPQKTKQKILSVILLEINKQRDDSKEGPIDDRINISHQKDFNKSILNCMFALYDQFVHTVLSIL